MGLDMYLNARITTFKSYNEEPTPLRAALVEARKLAFGDIDDTGRIGTIVLSAQIGYWRKSNQIHRWFVNECANGVDECQPISVSDEKLGELLGLCKQVALDPTRAKELLPPAAGFFFGSTDIDEWYMSGIQQTIDILETALALGETNPFVEFEYHASW